MNLHGLLDKAVATHSEKLAIIQDTIQLSYKDLYFSSLRMAEMLMERGIRKGDRIIILLPNTYHIVLFAIAASRIGAIFVVLHEETKLNTLEYIVRDAEPSLIISSRNNEILQDFNGIINVIFVEEIKILFDHYNLKLKNISSDEIACLIYTSGSSGNPKAVISKHKQIIFAVQAILEVLEIYESDVVGNFLPLSFDYGLYQCFLSISKGATVALGNKQDISITWINKLILWKVTVLPVVPSLADSLIKLAKRSRILPPLRLISNTGAMLPGKTIHEITTCFLDTKIYLMYGLTECKRVSIMRPEELAKRHTSVGKPLPGTVCLVVDSLGGIVSAGVQGELVVTGGHVMSGYWRQPMLTDKVFRKVENVIHLYTGDICHMDEEGYLYIHGRKDDVYKQNGIRISSLEVEQAALKCPDILEAALVPPSKEYSATLYVKTSLRQEAVWNYMRSILEDYKLPTNLLIIEEMPKNHNGKIDKRTLTEMFSKGGYNERVNY